MGAYLALGAATPARGGGDIVVTGTSANAIANSEVVVEVYADDVPPPGVGAFAIDVLYDNTALTYNGCTSNAAYCGSFPAEGRTRLAGAVAQGVTGRVSIANLRFTAAGTSQTTHIEFEVDQFATTESDELQTTTQDAVSHHPLRLPRTLTGAAAPGRHGLRR